MKESETIKEYSNKLSIINNIKLLGIDFSDSRIVQKILVTIPYKFETTMSSLENSKDLSSITLVELLNAQQVQEQRRLMRQERNSTPEIIRPAILKGFLPAFTFNMESCQDFHFNKAKPGELHRSCN